MEARGALDGVDDAGIGAAAADVAVHAGDDLGLSGIGRGVQQGGGAHDHTGGAVGALEGAGVEEGLLDGSELAVSAPDLRWW